MPSSIHTVDLNEALRSFHRQQCFGSRGGSDPLGGSEAEERVARASEFVSGWDTTVADGHEHDVFDAQSDSETISLHQRMHIRSSSSLTTHAVANLSWVYGVADTKIENHVVGDSQFRNKPMKSASTPGTQEFEIRWKTSLAPHRIHQVTSNASGTIIAATTDNGTVSILRGCDGRILATRRVAGYTTEDNDTMNSSSLLQMAPEVSFVKSDEDRINVRDALLVQTRDHPALLVSNIQGDRLNDENDAVVTQATKAMNLQVLQVPSLEPSDIQSMVGYFYGKQQHGDLEMDDDDNCGYCENIRLALIHHDSDGEAKLALAEYNLGSQICNLCRKELSILETSSWEIDAIVGLRLTSIDGRFLLALVAHPTHTIRQQKQSNCSKVLWLDPDYDLDGKSNPTLATFRKEYPLIASLSESSETKDHSTRYQRSRIQALDFLRPSDTKQAIAMIIATEETEGGKRSGLQVVQSHVHSGGDEILRLGRPHMVYRMKIPKTTLPVQSICVSPLDTEIYGPYSFRWKTSFGWNHPGEIGVFRTRGDRDFQRDAASIGTIRLLITKNEFNKARALVHEVGMEVLLEDEFARFHPAEIVLERLQLVLLKLSRQDSNTAELNDEWCDSLRSLERGAGNSKGQCVVLEAADCLLSWPPQGTSSALHTGDVIRKLYFCLSSFVDTLNKVSEDFLDQDVPSWIATTYRNRVTALEEKTTTISYLNSLLGNHSFDASSKNFPVASEYSYVCSVDDLFYCFVEHSNFSAARDLWESRLRSKLTSNVMVASILKINASTDPQMYKSLLNDIVLPNLSINHELLPSILSWACRTADEFDEADEGGLDRSIFLLETVVRATKKLRLRVHSSFAHYSPFVEQTTGGTWKGRLLSHRERNGTNVSMSGTFSLDGSFMSETQSSVTRSNDDSLLVEKRATKKQRTDSYTKQPNPTILELGHMKQGASRLGQSKPPQVDTIDEKEENVERKLETALWLRLARSLGLDRNLVGLRYFEDQGGPGYIAKELIRHYSSNVNSHEDRYRGLTNQVKKFCTASLANYDKALLDYSRELCRGKNTSSRAIEEVASIARCCLNATAKCEVTKIALQAALFCRFSASWLTDLSRDAIEWSAGNSTLRSELEEASRLLLIDGIVGRYCGNGAKELFHVDNPLHATRLLDFVSKHLDQETVLSDILDLCEAFHHLTMEDGCGRLIQNMILRGHQEKAQDTLRCLYTRNATSAQNVFSRVLAFCIDLLEENSSLLGPFPSKEKNVEISMYIEESKTVMSCAYGLTNIALSYAGTIVNGRFGSGFATALYRENKLKRISVGLERLMTLQEEYGICLSLSDLRNPKVLVGIASKLLAKLADMYAMGKFNAATIIATKTKRACSILSQSPGLMESDLLFSASVPLACQMAFRTSGVEAIDFLTDLRILEASQCERATRCCLAVILSYCTKLSKKTNGPLLDTMKGLVMAASLIQDYVLSRSPPHLLGVSINFSLLCDIVSQVLVRADEGVGEELDEFRKVLLKKAAGKRWTFALPNTNNRRDGECSMRVNRSPLHPSWYVGDGLLLPPEEALRKGVDYCKQSMGLQIMEEPSMGIHSFVANRGAHSLALRILSHSTMTHLCLQKSVTYLNELSEFNQNLGIALVERYLGGTGNGITSGIVDSQLATSFLLSLPLKLAFKIYRSSLPTAINTRDFSRVVTLATIGKVSGSMDSILSPTGARLGNWTRQSKFVSQCERLAIKANWWNVLEENGVNFNPHKFDDENLGENIDESYVASMVGSLISKMMSGKNADIDHTLSITGMYAEAFSLPKDLPSCHFIRYLLNPEESHENGHVKSKLSSLNDTVTKLLRSIKCSSKRVQVLRESLRKSEGKEQCTDYERLSVIYALYNSELSFLLSKNSEHDKENIDNLYAEIDAIDRRRDALAILSTYFQGDKMDKRPSFSRLFAPLSESIDDKSNSKMSTKVVCSRILGWEAPQKPDTFDPLDPLNTILRSSCSAAVTSGLSPLCIPLGVPRGYIRARSLIARFQTSREEGAPLPSYKDDVMPILNQLRNSSDVAELAEWCSRQYSLGTPDKLASLDHALNFAIKASTEAEHISSQSQKIVLPEDAESEALDKVKYISATKDLLADRLEITRILKPVDFDESHQGPTTKVLEKLLCKLEEEVWEKVDVFVPESFVDTLLTEASLLVAECTLCEDDSLSVGQFRELSDLIHRVCDFIGSKYSHVQPTFVASRLTRRWLCYGGRQATDDDNNSSSQAMPVLSQNSMIPDIEEDDTMDFQMDLSILKEDVDLDSGLSARNPNSNLKVKLTSEEEPSSLEPISGREISEWDSKRSALRVAFVMAFADGYSQRLLEDSKFGNNENLKPATNRIRRGLKIPRQGLLSKTKMSRTKEIRDHHQVVMDYARDLIHIVFAKSSSADRILRGLNTSIDSSMFGGASRNNSSTITFAMRHRCLRVASILIPQDALEEVICDDELTPNASLNFCSFAAFCAKELEEMGLPIPHSDLSQLSKMHFPSYSRALWRHHRNTKRERGRLLLLILELYLRESISDYGFFTSIFNEIDSMNLPRTLLMAFEGVVRYMEKIGVEQAVSFLEQTFTNLSRNMVRLLQNVFADIERNIDIPGDSVSSNLRRSTLNTLDRLSKILCAFSSAREGQDLLVTFSEKVLEGFLSVAKTNIEGHLLRNVLEYSISRIETEKIRVRLFERLSNSYGRLDEH